MTVKQSEQYQLVIRSLSDRIVEAQAPIRILDAIKWDDSLREEFFRKRCKSIPDVGPDYYAKRPLGFDPAERRQVLQQNGRRYVFGGIKTQLLDFQFSHIMKWFKAGDHVKIVGGRYSGETGTVVHVEKAGRKYVSVIMTDNGCKEIKVFVSHLRETTEVSLGMDSLCG